MSRLRVFCDFDGTVAKKDVGRELFLHFLGPRAEEIGRAYRENRITARECLRSQAELVAGVTREDVGAFVDQFDVDDYFGEFRTFCTLNEIPLVILSDGLDFYVERILRSHGAGDCDFFANHAEFVSTDGVGKLEVSFPYTDSECDLCGNCKRNHMLTQTSDDESIVYVGDGISDRCPVRYADIVFAKRDLIRYCQQENISYFEYATFREVRQRLEQLLAKKRINRRREAVMARRDVFMQG